MFFAGIKVASNKPSASKKITADKPVVSGCDWVLGMSDFTTVELRVGRLTVETREPPSGTPPVVASRLPIDPGWTDEVGVPAPAEVPAVWGSCVAFWVPAPVVTIGSVLAISLSIAA